MVFDFSQSQIDGFIALFDITLSTMKIPEASPASDTSNQPLK